MPSFALVRAFAVYCFVTMSLLAFGSGAASAATVVLRDGTVIQGEVKSLQDGVYTIQTALTGELRVRKEDIRSIDENGHSAQPPTGADLGLSLGQGSVDVGALDAVRSRIAQDPNLLEAVLALQNDPDVLAILSDPQIMKAVAAGDFTSLMRNPKIEALMNNEKVRDIVGKTQ